MKSFVSTLKEYINAKTQVIQISGPDHTYIKDCILSAGMDLSNYVFFWDRVRGTRCATVTTLFPFLAEDNEPETTEQLTFNINTEESDLDEELRSLENGCGNTKQRVPDYASLVDSLRGPNQLSSETALFKLLYYEGYKTRNKKGKPLLGKDLFIPRYCDSGYLHSIADRERDEWDALKWFHECPIQKMVLVIEDPMFGFNGVIGEPKFVSMTKFLASCDEDKVLILISPNTKGSIEVPPDVVHLHAPYPDKDALRKVFHTLKVKSGYPSESFEECDEIFDALKGLTVLQARRILTGILSTSGHIKKEDAREIGTYKTDILNSSGLIEYVETTRTIDDLGGLDILKKWLISRKNLDSSDRKKYKLEPEKGIILVGPPGTGKSLGAAVAASILNVPLIRFDISKVFDQWVGLSEQNMRKALANIEVMTPCVLLCDEIEKALSGSKSNSESSATTPRVFGIFLDWLSHSHDGIFVIAAGNSLESLPPEFSRKGRFDEIFYVSYPGPNSRREILDINFKKHALSGWEDSQMNMLVNASSGFSGAEIEVAINEALIHCLSNRECINADAILQEFNSTIPQSRGNSSVIQYCQESGTQIATPASSERWEEMVVVLPAEDAAYR